MSSHQQLVLPLEVAVPSRSHPGDFYRVVGSRCTCAGFVSSGHCYHVAEADVEAIFGPAEPRTRPKIQEEGANPVSSARDRCSHPTHGLMDGGPLMDEA